MRFQGSFEYLLVTGAAVLLVALAGQVFIESGESLRSAISAEGGSSNVLTSVDVNGGLGVNILYPLDGMEVVAPAMVVVMWEVTPPNAVVDSVEVYCNGRGVEADFVYTGENPGYHVCTYDEGVGETEIGVVVRGGGSVAEDWVRVNVVSEKEVSPVSLSATWPVEGRDLRRSYSILPGEKQIDTEETFIAAPVNYISGEPLVADIDGDSVEEVVSIGKIYLGYYRFAPDIVITDFLPMRQELPLFNIQEKINLVLTKLDPANPEYNKFVEMNSILERMIQLYEEAKNTIPVYVKLDYGTISSTSISKIERAAEVAPKSLLFANQKENIERVNYIRSEFEILRDELLNIYRSVNSSNLPYIIKGIVYCPGRYYRCTALEVYIEDLDKKKNVIVYKPTTLRLFTQNLGTPTGLYIDDQNNITVLFYNKNQRVLISVKISLKDVNYSTSISRKWGFRSVWYILTVKPLYKTNTIYEINDLLNWLQTNTLVNDRSTATFLTTLTPKRKKVSTWSPLTGWQVEYQTFYPSLKIEKVIPYKDSFIVLLSANDRPLLIVGDSYAIDLVPYLKDKNAENHLLNEVLSSLSRYKYITRLNTTRYTIKYGLPLDIIWIPKGADSNDTVDILYNISATISYHYYNPFSRSWERDTDITSGGFMLTLSLNKNGVEKGNLMSVGYVSRATVSNIDIDGDIIDEIVVKGANYSRVVDEDITLNLKLPKEKNEGTRTRKYRLYVSIPDYNIYGVEANAVSTGRVYSVKSVVGEGTVSGGIYGLIGGRKVSESENEYNYYIDPEKAREMVENKPEGTRGCTYINNECYEYVPGVGFVNPETGHVTNKSYSRYVFPAPVYRTDENGSAVYLGKLSVVCVQKSGWGDNYDESIAPGLTFTAEDYKRPGESTVYVGFIPGDFDGDGKLELICNGEVRGG